MSHFFAYLSRMRLINRWSLMRNTVEENIQEHSYQVAVIAHALAIVRNNRFNGDVNPERVAVLALYHDFSEVITGDLPSPIKYFNPQIKTAYKEIEEKANERLFHMLPSFLQNEYEFIFYKNEDDEELWNIVKAADKLAAYIKCVEEIKGGNSEFSAAKTSLLKIIKNLDLPEVNYFLEEFLPSFELTLDDLNFPKDET